MQFCYITVLWIQGVTVIFLVQGREEMAFMPAVTAVPLYICAMDIGIDCNDISTGRRGKNGYACSYCSTVASQ